jgi:hypothetical protein
MYRPSGETAGLKFDPASTVNCWLLEVFLDVIQISGVPFERVV